MILKLDTFVRTSHLVEKDVKLKLSADIFRGNNDIHYLSGVVAYPSFINSHDHLIGNWTPRAGENNPYLSTDIWVEEMKNSEAVIERNKIWINDGEFDLLTENAPLLAKLGCYKNIFSGCSVVQDHAPNQIEEYYDLFPINILRNYTQCHSLSMGNWWGGKSAVEEWKASKGKIPFILHLAEGDDDVARSDFKNLVEENLLHSNTLIIHGISLSKDEIATCAKVGASICICPSSNIFLIGKTIDIDACLESGVNLVLGTDSTLSGSSNLFEEMKYLHKLDPQITPEKIFEMVTQNAEYALKIPSRSFDKDQACSDLLLLKEKHSDPFKNILECGMEDIELLLHEGKPIYGNLSFLEMTNLNQADYSVFEIGSEKKFVIGHPDELMNQINSILGYKKNLPYLPF